MVAIELDAKEKGEKRGVSLTSYPLKDKSGIKKKINYKQM